MDPRVLSIVVIFVGFGTSVDVVVADPTTTTNQISSDIAKLLLDCKLSTSITFTDCLKRLKRHPHVRDIDHHCMESCMAECVKEEGKSCAESCKHCMQTTIKYKHHVINITETEYETECSSGNCTKATAKKDNPVIVNVTNHIHIHNHYNTSSSPTETNPTIRENGNQPDCPCYFITWFPCYCRPQYPICQYPYEWLCSPYMRFGRITPEAGPCVYNPISTAKSTVSTISTVPTIPTIPTMPSTPSIPTKSTTSTISTKPTTISTTSTKPTIPTISTKPSISTTPSQISDFESLRNLDRRSHRQGRWRF